MLGETNSKIAKILAFRNFDVQGGGYTPPGSDDQWSVKSCDFYGLDRFQGSNGVIKVDYFKNIFIPHVRMQVYILAMLKTRHGKKVDTP